VAANLYPLLLLLSLALPSSALAGFQVLSWDLTTGVQDFSDGADQDVDRHLTVTNPWQFTSLSSLDDGGISISQAAYDYHWTSDLSEGQFNTDLTQALRSDEATSIAYAFVFIRPDTDVRITLDAFLTYGHTPGDETDITFGAGVVNMAESSVVFTHSFQGGNGLLLPAAGEFAIHDEAILEAGITYRVRYTVDARNTFDLNSPPTGICDTAGWVRYQITPVPAPGTLSLLGPVLGSLMLRRPRRSVR